MMFCHAAGKQRMPLVTKALLALGVPVKAIVDFDALNNRNVLKSLVEGMGCEYSEDLERDRRLIDSHIRGSSVTLTLGGARQAIGSALDNEGDPSSVVSPEAIQVILKAIYPEAGWLAAKRSGKYAVPAGDASVALERLLKRLRDQGVFVVPCGEVESFVKSVPGKGPQWVVEAIKEEHLASAEEAREFMGAVAASFGKPF